MCFVGRTQEIMADVVDNNDGTYTVSYCAAKYGDYLINATLNGGIVVYSVVCLALHIHPKPA